jgi:hypothetical protein
MSGCEVERLGGHGREFVAKWTARRQQAAGCNRYNMLQPIKDVVTDTKCHT